MKGENSASAATPDEASAAASLAQQALGAQPVAAPPSVVVQSDVIATQDAAFRAFVQAAKPDELNISVLEHFHFQAYMSQFTEGFLIVADEDALAKYKLQRGRMMKCVTEMQTNIVSATTTLSKHVNSMLSQDQKTALKAVALELQRADWQRHAAAVKTAAPVQVQYSAVLSLHSSGFEAWPCVHFDGVQDVEFLKLP